ncbi:MAG: uracil-DNA glycosylase [Planctomycetota bacterium]|jgi:DNA polymerase
MTVDPQQLRRAARQDLATSLLMGVDFVPVPGADAPGQAARRGGDRHEAKQAALDALRERHDAECPHCTAATAHARTVFGEGDPDADLMFIGEAPGAEEDRTGRPFVGRAGQKLDDMIRALGLEREQVYIANVLKSRPPNNRTPQADEVAGCSPYLTEQIRIIEPRVIVTLGGPAMKLMLGTDVGITRMRGQWAEHVSDDGTVRVPVMPTFHPAYLLRNYTRETRQKVWSDLQAALARLSDDG